jgi:hypothetical protein
VTQPWTITGCWHSWQHPRPLDVLEVLQVLFSVPLSKLFPVKMQRIVAVEMLYPSLQEYDSKKEEG